MRKWCTLLLAVLTVSACDIDGAATPGVSVADSAGVQIVSSEAATWATGEQWRLGDRPRIEIGVIEGDLVYQFDRIMGAITMSDGRVAVADMGSSQVRLFDRTGQHLMSVGGTGDGPGEFRQITGMYRLNGEGFAVENRRHRIQTFGPDGALRGSVPVGDFSRDIDPVTFHLNPPASVHVVGWLEDGSFVGWRSTQPTLTADRRFEETETLHHTYGRFGSDGEDLTEIVAIPGTVFHPHPMGLILPAVFGPAVHTAVSGDRLVVGTSGTGEVAWYTLEGELERIARMPWPRTTVTEEMIGQYVAGSAPPLTESLAQNRTFEEHLPAFSGLIVDALGNVWLRRYEVSHSFTTMQYIQTFDERSRWVVLSPTRGWLGEVEMPARFTALEIGEDYVLGLRRDEFDVEYVQVYDLEKP